MEALSHTPDWSLFQSFLAVAETGSLSAAARRLGTSQPTVGRHVQALEEQIGAHLFLRKAKGMALSDAGMRLVEPARRMAEAAGQMAVTAAGVSEEISGTVRVTAAVFTANYQLSPIFADIRAKHPEIELEVVANDATENLLFREADIAVRMYRPQQLDVITSHLGDFALGLYASKSYIERVGTPQSPQELIQRDMVGYDRQDGLIRGMRAYGWDVNRESFSVRCDSHSVYLQLVLAGCGIGVLQCNVADQSPDIVKILPDLPLPGLPVWLTAHPAVRRSPRVKIVWEALAKGLRPMLEPPGRLMTLDDPPRLDALGASG